MNCRMHRVKQLIFRHAGAARILGNVSQEFSKVEEKNSFLALELSRRIPTAEPNAFWSAPLFQGYTLFVSSPFPALPTDFPTKAHPERLSFLLYTVLCKSLGHMQRGAVKVKMTSQIIQSSLSTSKWTFTQYVAPLIIDVQASFKYILIYGTVRFANLKWFFFVLENAEFIKINIYELKVRTFAQYYI